MRYFLSKILANVSLTNQELKWFIKLCNHYQFPSRIVNFEDEYYSKYESVDGMTWIVLSSENLFVGLTRYYLFLQWICFQWMGYSLRRLDYICIGDYCGPELFPPRTLAIQREVFKEDRFLFVTQVLCSFKRCVKFMTQMHTLYTI